MLPRALQPSPRACLLSLSLLAVFACGPERPPQADAAERATPAKAEPPVFDPNTDQFVLTYAGERGVFADCTSLAEVPAEARARVGVNVFGAAAPPGKVWVANLDAPLPDGRFALDPVDRDEFETAVLGTGRSSVYAMPTDLESLEQIANREAPIIVYKTSWCGVCKQLEKYLDRKGVEYVAKDIEKDRTAAAELQAKAKAKGVPTGSVPMIDIGGELLRGFDKNAIEKLL
ncbi:glutaredoxin domain-containing protein [Enhygromyxa salina]|uniref:Glutaredoxin n=1 Tax=Enhygromyxa salina TaxID=215803 RepID=A0A2S9YQH2_9BACT|nr:glutaredoxin domain-containing protein [Enhygromyxa salina]PRQ07312.1 Glutaredoxin [Enhygromyxa salina]